MAGDTVRVQKGGKSVHTRMHMKVVGVAKPSDVRDQRVDGSNVLREEVLTWPNLPVALRSARINSFKASSYVADGGSPTSAAATRRV